jgi:segregation and condensation protein A
MALMLDRLLTSDQLVFQELLAQTFSRLEIAVTLLALLELIKLGQVGVYQERLFGSIVIRSRAAQAENASAAAR